MRFKVTGGTDGTAGVEVGDRRYEPGDIVELTGPKAAWLVEKGYLESADGKAVKIVAEADPEPDTPQTEKSPAEEPTDANGGESDTEEDVA
jgi:hypothetical protein